MRTDEIRDWWRGKRRALKLLASRMQQAFSDARRESGIRYNLAACLRFKNAAPYLAEWIEFHRIVGVEHFFLYSNNSEDDFRPVLAPFIEDGVVTFHDWPEIPALPGTNEHCVSKYGHQCRWIAFLDDDEFLFSPKKQDLRKVLTNYERYPAVAVHWLMFGSAGHEKRPEGPVIENYTRCAKSINPQIKSIVNPYRISSYKSSHHWKYLNGDLAVNERKLSVLNVRSEPACADTLRINHYWSKSLEDSMNKISRGSPDQWGFDNPRSRELWEQFDAEMNHVTDTTILRFLPELKDRLARHQQRVSTQEANQNS